MSVSLEYRTFIEDLFSGFGQVSIRSMFGGAGVFHDGLMFGLIADETLYLKVDESNRADFESEGMAPFSYEARGRPMTLAYWEVPESLYDDPDAFAAWARKAFTVAFANKKR